MRIGLFLFFVFVLAGRAVILESRPLPGGSEARLIAPINGLPSGGFFPFRVEIENNGKDTLFFALECTATLRKQMGYRFGPFRDRSDGQGQTETRYEFSCPAGEERRLEFLIPVPQTSEDDERYLNLALKDPKNGRFWASTMVTSDEDDLSICYSASVMEQFRRALRNLSVRNSSRSGSAPLLSRSQTGVFEVDDLPADWRAFAGYNAFVLNRADLQAVAPGVKVALDQWVRSGGHLIVLDDSDSPANEGFRLEQDGFGQRTVLTCGPGYQKFKGATLVNVINARGKLWSEVHTQYANDWPVGQELGSRSLGTGLVLFGLMVFAVMVGPVNLFVWAKPTRRHRLFVTTPIISVAASLIMVGLIILSDGFGGDGARAIAIDVGSPDDKTATVVQEQFSRSGILFSSGFTLDDQSVLNPVRPPVSEMNRVDSAYSTGTFQLQVSRNEEGWKYSGDLFESRSEQGQLIRSVVPSREGLALVSQAGGTPELASSFSYSIGPVFYKDRDGEIWRAGEIAPGESVTLQKSSYEEQEKALNSAVSRFGRSYRTVLQRMFQREQSFAALASEAPGVETHTSIDWEKSPVLVTGLTAP